IKENENALRDEVDEIGQDVEDVVGRVTEVESKVTDEAIINKVTSSEKYLIDLQTVEDKSRKYVQSRTENLVTNGTGLLGDNTNFSQWEFDGSQSYAGGGSFKTTRQNGTMFSDELI